MQHLTSVQHSFFQYMIGNTDFSISYQHNGKLLFAEKAFLPLPYDFDMTGWVNPSYGFGNPTLDLSSLTERRYRGFKRDKEVFDTVRNQFIGTKDQITSLVKSFELEFDSKKQYETMFGFMEEFFEIIEDDSKFKKLILDQARTK